MDYNILLSSLDGKNSEFDSLSVAVNTCVDDGINTLGSISGSEIQGLLNNVEKSLTRLKNGYKNCSTWLSEYVSGLKSLESSLAAFQGTNIEAPVEFKEGFSDLFGKRVITTLKAGGNVDNNLSLGEIAIGNQALIDAILPELGKTIEDYPGLGFHEGQWCADFASQMLINQGYDIPMSPVAGDAGDSGDIFTALRERGAVVHLDIGAEAMGFGDSSEYDPSYSPQVGDVVLFNWDNDDSTDHVGFVIQDNGDGTIKTIEGNTSGDAGSSCVAIRQRDRGLVYGYATPQLK